MKKIQRLVSAVLFISIVASQSQGFASAYYKSEPKDSESIAKGVMDVEDRTGKIVRIYVDEEGNPTQIIELSPESQQSTRAMGDVTLVSTRRLDASQTKAMQESIKGMTQLANISATFLPFVPAPFSVFLAAARVSVFAQDVRWAGAYGHAILLKEYCESPHTSYSHYYEYEIL